MWVNTFLPVAQFWLKAIVHALQLSSWKPLSWTQADRVAELMPDATTMPDEGIEFELDEEECYMMNGSCMPGPGRIRSRSPPVRRWVACVRESSSSGSGRPCAGGGDSLTLASAPAFCGFVPGVCPLTQASPPASWGFVPSLAKHIVSNLPGNINCRFPKDGPADNMDRQALLRHCHSWISRVRAFHLQRWYIGITSCPPLRFDNDTCGHYRNYEWMWLLFVSVSSELTHSLETELVETYLYKLHDITLQNVDPYAKGSMRGSPSFLYVTWDRSGPLWRR